MSHTDFETPFGCCQIGWNEKSVTSFRLPPESSADHPSAVRHVEESPAWVTAIIARVRLHLKGTFQDFSDVPIDWSLVSEFQRGVYYQTLAVGPGFTTTYGKIAKALGLGFDASRAVGTALGSNPWPLIVPCHRVIAANGKMTGFSAPGGIRTKTRLLALEGAELISE